ncbi:MAG: orotidine-5'-phosphate decarboxylase [Betaproteobacteria bacterium]|nr:orotidine-5'-phosphate decarboxylase [Betaproteobacteria bacterium]
MTDPKIIVALDFPSLTQAQALARRLDPQLCRLKIGKELFTASGPASVEAIQAEGFDVFLDLKFHDIPNTVASAVRAATRLGVWMLNVHALGGRAMLSAAAEAAEQAQRRPRLIAVTVLTSMGAGELAEVGIEGSPEAAVMRLAGLAQSCGLDGVVCSAREAKGLREKLGGAFCLVTPGIRPAEADAGDQVRTMTPAQAMANGASYLVVGRPVTQAADPLEALRAIHRQIIQS